MVKKKIKRWKYKRVDKFRDLWTKGDERFGDFIILDKSDSVSLRYFPNEKYQVRARRKINPKTIFGKSKFYKSKSSAMDFIKKYLKKY